MSRITMAAWAALGLGLAACGGAPCQETTATARGGDEMVSPITDEVIGRAVTALVKKHGEAERARIEIGVKQAAARWRETDGTAEDFEAVCLEGFAATPEDRAVLLERFEDNLEQLLGHLHEVQRYLRTPTDLDLGPVKPIDRLFAAYDPSDNVVEDLFRSKVAFHILLNFEEHDLVAKLGMGGAWSRAQWAEARAADLFSSRVPPAVSQRITAAFAAADDYITSYNIHMHQLLTADGRRLFPEGMKLISHWGLRDELKTHYGSKEGLERQRLIHLVMERIVAQEIPAAVIDNPDVDWVVETGELRAAKGAAPDPAREPDTRYRKLLDTFHAVRLADPYEPSMPTYIDRKFQREREIPRDEVERLLTSVLGSPVIADVAQIVSARIGRPLQPFDIWYDGFAGRGDQDQTVLDRQVRERYPTVEAFQKDLQSILERLGFAADTAAMLGRKIVVDPARGAGHAMGAERRQDAAHLRTRFEQDGMNFKGFNIAVHELGHNVEQVLSLDRIDRYLLSGVPNTAFTEGFAFAFQAKDAELLGVPQEDPLAEHLRTLDILWTTFEIAGVGLVDMRIWDWMYAHPDAEPAELREAVLEIARGVWNEYYAKVFGVRDQVLLAVYSHIIDAGMYVPDYPIGFLIQFQIEAHFAKKGLAAEMERMCALGSITPDAWMRAAVGSPLSAEPLLEAGRAAVAAVGKAAP
ncbi:MAG TPA: hypothetical protein VM285_03105 [Polyangia bacterium]|nr:hypothetical protein [Polyangia bacterium]